MIVIAVLFQCFQFQTIFIGTSISNMVMKWSRLCLLFSVIAFDPSLARVRGVQVERKPKIKPFLVERPVPPNYF